jgi:hypothetical protein
LRRRSEDTVAFTPSRIKRNPITSRNDALVERIPEFNPLVAYDDCAKPSLNECAAVWTWSDEFGVFEAASGA